MLFAPNMGFLLTQAGGINVVNTHGEKGISIRGNESPMIFLSAESKKNRRVRFAWFYCRFTGSLLG